MSSIVSTRRRAATLGAALILAATVSTASLAEHPLVNLSLGFAYSSDFNGDNGGFTASTPPAPPTTSWAWGTPTSGPQIAASGTKVFATNPAGQYSLNDCGAIVSPAIDLTGATSASVSFAQWRHMEASTSATGTAFDAGMLFVTNNGGASYSVVTPAGGYGTQPISTTTRTCLKGQPTTARGLSGPGGTTAPPPTYSTITTDLTAFAGQTVRFAIAFGSDGSVNRDGWYVDDFTTTINGVPTTQDFEASNGGFTVESWGVPKAPLGWSYGTQSGTGGPGVAASQPPLWATNLAGNFGFNECSSIESPPINLWPTGQDLAQVDDGLANVEADLAWDQWYQSFTSAGGVVQVGHDGTYTNVEPETGYPSNPVAALDACLQDDTQGTGAFASTAGSTDGGPLTRFRADLTPWVGKTITVRYLFASTNTATLDAGWYVDNVEVELRARVDEPHPPEPPSDVPFTPVQDLYTEGFEAGNGSYTSGGTGTGASTWAHGVPTAPPAPQAGQGPSMWGTNLTGNYNTNECSWLRSPVIDLSSVPSGAPAGQLARLSFAHYLETENSYDGGIVQVSTDGGTTWTTLQPVDGYDDTMNPAARTCLGLSTTDLAFTGAGTTEIVDWKREAFDVTSYLGGSVAFRWLFASDGSIQDRGWYVDDVAVTVGVGAETPDVPEVPSEVPTIGPRP